MTLLISPVDPGREADIDAMFRVTAAAEAADHPEMPATRRDQFIAQVRTPQATKARHSFVARLEDGSPAGELRLDLPEADNTNTVQCSLTVHPQYRRRGVGRALFEYLAQFAREHDRSVLMGEYCVAHLSGPPRDSAPSAFAQALGIKPALYSVHRRLELDTVDRGGWPELMADALGYANGYTPVWWAGATPEVLVDDRARLEGRMVLDIPLGDLDLEPEVYDVERIRAQEEVARRRGERSFQAGAVEGATGHLVAVTELKFSTGHTEWAWQSLTIVDPGHRGHRLGILIKLHNLVHTAEAEPALRAVDTWNAEENGHMVAINEAIGFQILDGLVEWQHDVRR